MNQTPNTVLGCTDTANTQFEEYTQQKQLVKYENRSYYFGMNTLQDSYHAGVQHRFAKYAGLVSTLRKHVSLAPTLLRKHVSLGPTSEKLLTTHKRWLPAAMGVGLLGLGGRTFLAAHDKERQLERIASNPLARLRYMASLNPEIAGALVGTAAGTLGTNIASLAGHDMSTGAGLLTSLGAGGLGALGGHLYRRL